MMNHIKIALFWMLLTAASKTSAQNFNSLLPDIDSSSAWGYTVFNEADTAFMVIGSKLSHKWDVIALRVSIAGDQILVNNNFGLPASDCHNGLTSKAKLLSSGNYLAPFSVHRPSSAPFYESVNAGYSISDKNGSLLYYKLYNTDTANYLQDVLDAIQLPDGGYLLAGVSTKRSTRYRAGQLIRTDGSGNVIWIKPYTYLGYKSTITGLELLDNNTVLVSASVDEIVVIGKNDPIEYCHPWFMKIDLNGTVLKDTIYMAGFAGLGRMGGGNIYKDKNGGYFHFGQIDKIYDSTALDWIANFPDYLMHLDDNFRVTWMTPFMCFPGHKYIWTAKQLHDNNYLVLCSAMSSGIYSPMGWAAKINRDGFIMWDHRYYYKDSTKEAYLTDAVELRDRSIVFTGTAYDPTRPTPMSDVWMLKVDSNGCEIPGCAPTSIKPTIAANSDDIKVYPNPFSEELTVFSSQSAGAVGTSRSISGLQLVDVYGRVVYSGVVNGDKAIIDTRQLPPGNYVLVLIGKNGERTVRKVVKE